MLLVGIVTGGLRANSFVVFQKIKQVFPVAEELKSKLTRKYNEIEKKRQEEEV